jgi:hypothetical protein
MSPSWEVVDAFGVGVSEHDVLGTVEATVGDVQRFRSDVDGRAVLVPVGSILAGAASGVALTGRLQGGVEVLFVDPATGDNARSLLVALGDRARSVRAALPKGTDVAGLVPEGSQVSVTVRSRPAVLHVLFRLADGSGADWDRLAAGPRVAESEDVVDQRSKWFEAREGTEGRRD